MAPGMRPDRLSSQPSAAAPSRVAAMTMQNSSESWVKLATIAGVMLAETIAPMIACAPRYGRRGTSRRTPLTPNTIPPTIGPISRPAGKPAAPQTSEMKADSARVPTH